MGAAVSPFVTLPSGSASKYTGESTITGGLKGIYDVTIKKNKIVANLGLRFRQRENLLNLRVGQEVLYGVGYTRPIREDWDLHGVTELNGSTSLTAGRAEGRGRREITLA